MRADGLITGTERVTFRGFLIGHQSMVESGVLVNTMNQMSLICPVECSLASSFIRKKNSGAALPLDGRGVCPYVVGCDICFAGCV